MSEETTTPVEAPQIAEGTRSPVESKVSTEVAPNKSQNQDLESPDYGALVQESKKYRARAQQSESDLANLQKQIDADRQKQMEEQNEWQQLAEERALKLSELEPIVEQAQRDEAQMREQILADFSEEDRETFGDLPLSKLRVLSAKLNPNNPRVPIANNPAVPSNEVPQDWTKMNRSDRVKHWDKIVESYRQNK
tara:strand:+ start:229 stop:810 length:582 start_codon:yes stop_codon:yes gene_type:complete